MNNNFLNEYPCIDVKEKDYLTSKGIRYSFVKVVDKITTWKYIKTKELFIALAEYNLKK